MLNNKILKLAQDITETAAFSNKGFIPRSQSPIEVLFKSLALENTAGTDDDFINAVNNRTSIMGSYEHVERGLVGTYSNIVSNIINAARNTVKPLVDKLVSDIQESHKRSLLKDTKLFKEVIQLVPPKIVYDEQFTAMLAEYTEIVYPNLTGLNAILAELYTILSDAELTQLALTGSGVLDLKLQEVYGTDNFHLEVTDASAPDDQPLKPALKLFMLMNGIINYRSDKVSYLIDDKIKERVVLTIRNALGGVLHRLFSMYTIDVDQGILFCKRPKIYADSSFYYGEGDKIFVYAKAYSDWIANKGGSIEALLGYVSDKENQHYYGGEELIKDPAFYVGSYNSKLRTLNLTKSLTEVATVKKTTQVMMEQYINGAYIKGTPDFILYHERLNHAIAHDYHGPADLIPYLIKVVSRTLYPSKFSASNEINRSDVKDLLLEVHSATINIDNPNYEEALLLATVRLICNVLTKDIETI